jgi:hypothetical protein
VDLTDEELRAVYDCLRPEMVAATQGAELFAAKRWGNFERYSTISYRSDTHGGRLVNNYANHIAADTYGQYEEVRRMPTGSILAKDSFVVNANGTVSPGPLFLMEKMVSGFSEDTGDWRYAMVMPDGSVFGVTGGPNSTGLQFCHDCHVTMEDNDMMFFMPAEYRK